MFNAQWKIAIVTSIVFQVVILIGHSDSLTWLAALVLIFINGIVWIMRHH